MIQRQITTEPQAVVEHKKVSIYKKFKCIMYYTVTHTTLFHQNTRQQHGKKAGTVDFIELEL